jgi:uncharacterized surface protein with fasciclin (FAS1) repeats
MYKSLRTGAVALALTGLGGIDVTMAANPMVGGAAMYETKSIVENAMNSKDHTTLVAAVKQAGLVDTLSSKGPFTVFAPVNAAFDALPAGTVDSLMKPDAKDKLTKVLTAHVVPGKMSGADLATKAKTMNGQLTLKTVSGDDLTVKLDGNAVWIVDENGGTARVTIADVDQSNGVIHVIDKVLLPR